jgi:hypothetical protein
MQPSTIIAYIGYGLLVLLWINVVAMASWTMGALELLPGDDDLELGSMPSFVDPDLVAERLRHPPELLPDF